MNGIRGHTECLDENREEEEIRLDALLKNTKTRNCSSYLCLYVLNIYGSNELGFWDSVPFIISSVSMACYDLILMSHFLCD